MFSASQAYGVLEYEDTMGTGRRSSGDRGHRGVRLAPAERVGTSDGCIRYLILPLHMATLICQCLLVIYICLVTPCSSTTLSHISPPHLGREPVAERRSAALRLGSLAHDWARAEGPCPSYICTHASTTSPQVQEQVNPTYLGIASFEAKLSVCDPYACVEQDACRTLTQRIVKPPTWSSFIPRALTAI